MSGSGDLCGEHVPAILKLAESCPQTVFWGFTRSREIAEQINHRHDNLSLILSIDATSAEQELSGFAGPLAFGPRGPQDAVPYDPRIIVVFPVHRAGRTDPDVPVHPRDCPATRGPRHHACLRCQRCYRPFEHAEEER